MAAGKNNFSLANFLDILRLVVELPVFLSERKVRNFTTKEYFDIEVAACRWVFPIDQLAFSYHHHQTNIQ